MSSMPERFVFDPSYDSGAPTEWAVQTIVADLSQVTDKGYSYSQGVGKAFTGALEASVAGDLWTSIDALGASAQGSIAAHYNYVRLNITAKGVPGTNTRIVLAGKVL